MQDHITLIVTVTLLVIAAIAVLTMAGGIAVYTSSVRRMISRRERQKPLEQLENCFVSPDEISQLTNRFEDDENIVHWADRQDYIVVIPVVVAFGLLAVGFLILAAFMAVRIGTVHFTFHHNVTVNHPKTHVVTRNWNVRIAFLKYLSVLPLLVALFLGFLVANNYLRWKAFIRSITNKNLRVDIQPWPWAFWLWNDETHDPQPLHRIERIEEQGTIFGRIFGYGTLRVITLQQENTDELTHNLFFVRHYEEVAELLRRYREEARDAFREPLSSAEDEVTQLIPLWRPHPN